MILQKTTDLPDIPKRIVSLVPSLTELLYHLQLETETVGITKFCIHPPGWLQTKKLVGGTKTLNLQIIDALHPQLIIANKEENTREQIEILAKNYPVWLTDVQNLSDAINMIADLGSITGKKDNAENIIHQINTQFEKINPIIPPIKTTYLIWRKPYMTIGHDTFIQDMLSHCGFENMFADKTRYPVISINEILEKNCKLLLLSSEPYPFKQQHMLELQEQLPNTKIRLVDGELFSWYGSRLINSPIYFNQLIAELSALK